jgi:hypothetical protein
MTSTTAQNDKWEVVWDMYMNTFDQYDTRITNDWKGDPGSLLAFVSRTL